MIIVEHRKQRKLSVLFVHCKLRGCPLFGDKNVLELKETNCINGTLKSQCQRFIILCPEVFTIRGFTVFL